MAPLLRLPRGALPLRFPRDSVCLPMYLHRVFPLVLLVAFVACDTTDPGVTDPTNPPPHGSVVKWSEPGSWPQGRAPVEGEAVTIPAGVHMQLDVSPPPLAGITVEGTLEFDRKDLELVADWIRVVGSLEIGTEAQPFEQRARVVLTGITGADSIPGIGTRALGVVPGGTLDLHGVRRRAWTKLANTANAGASQLTLVNAVDWRPGDRIVVAPSGFDPREAEDRALVQVSGNSVTLDRPLTHTHFGALQTIEGRTVDERAEVGLLTHSISIRGVGVDDEGTVGGSGGFGGHIMILAGAMARIEGVELLNMGQRGQLARYPVHWHLAGSVAGQYFRSNSVWRSNNRCVTVHGTNHLLVEGNVCYDHQGHGFFLEDGAETGNELLGNLSVLARRPEPGDRLLPSDDRPASFWVTNPDNRLVGNSAAGSQGFGIWYALPEAPTGPSAGQPHLPRRTPLGEFKDNVAHSNQRGGLFVDLGPRPDGEVETASYRPVVDPTDPDSDPVPAAFEGLLAYKNRRRGVWLRGHEHRLTNAVLADNEIGATFASSESFMEDGLIAAETANSVGRLDVYRGFEFYDGRVGARRVAFWGFDGAGAIPWSALGYNRRNAFSVHTGNVAEEMTFTRSRRVYLEAPDVTKDGDKAAVFLDQMGSVTGTAGVWVTGNTAFLTTPACTLRADWNALVCPGPYVRLYMRAASNIAPLVARRDDGASESFVGSGNKETQASISVLSERSYDLTLAGPPAAGQISLRGGDEGTWVGVSFAYPDAAPTIVRDYWNKNVLLPAPSRAALDASEGEFYWYDSAVGRLHLKLFVQANRDWAHLRIKQ